MKNKISRMTWKLYAYMYDAATLRAIPYLEVLRDFSEFIVQYLANRNKSLPKILDACCGTGTFSCEIKKRVPQASVVGIDYTSEMIEKARKKCEGVEFVVSDLLGEIKKIDSNSIDVVLSKNGFYPLPDKENTVAEIYRVLNSEGLFILSDTKPGAKLSVLVKYHFSKSNFWQKLYFPFFVGALFFSLLLQHGSGYSFPAREEMSRILESKGFTIIKKDYVYARQNYLLIAIKK